MTNEPTGQDFEMVTPDKLQMGNRIWTFAHVEEDNVDRVFVYTIAAVEPPNTDHPDEWEFKVEPVESHKERTVRVPGFFPVPRLL